MALLPNHPDRKRQNGRDEVFLDNHPALTGTPPKEGNDFIGCIG